MVLVSVSGFNAKWPGFESRWRIVNFSDVICRYLPRMSCYYVEIMRLFVVWFCVT